MTLSDAARNANVFNEVPQRPVTWTSVNVGEAAFPGVPTPLSWSWAWWPTEVGIRGGFAAMGPLPRALAPAPDDLADRVLTLQLGHAALNVDLFRRIGDGTPGSSASDVERSWFGSVRPGAHDSPRRGRYPVVAARMPWEAWRVRRRMARLQAETVDWWRTAARTRDLEPATARALIVDSQRRYGVIAVQHVVVGIVAQALYDAVGSLCARAEVPALQSALVPGGAEEGEWLDELWRVSHGVGSLEGFLARHGYHGPLEGELSSRSWREDPAPVAHLMQAYASATREPPAEIFARRARERVAAEADLLGRLPARARPFARGLLRAARVYMPLRESGRATFLRCYDAARVAARVLGADLAAQGDIDDPSDVFFLTLGEIRGEPESFQARVAARRALRLEYQSAVLPNLWTGRPEPVAVQPGSTNGGPVEGRGVSAGVVEGSVRVVVDPSEADGFEPGEILVCKATDPSWAALFYLASAVVVDIGGDMSHGAIVARELGLPAVVNTGDGTTRLRTGDRVRVDGATGTVTPLCPRS